MCGRYGRVGGKQKIAELFHARLTEGIAMPEADYNIAPSTYQPIVRQSREDGEREVVLARWGLIPFFPKDLKEIKGLSTINARSETIETAKSWREPLKKRRCIVPMSFYIEWPARWDKKDGAKPPHAIEMSGHGMFAAAGLWDAWKDEQGHWVQSYTIITTVANELTADFHPRMPVILRPRNYDRWLDRQETERPPVDLLEPFAAEEMTIRRINPAVNNVRNNGSEMMTCDNNTSL